MVRIDGFAIRKGEEMTQESRHRSQTGDGKRTADQSPAAGGLQTMATKGEAAGDEEGAERKPRASKKKKKR